MTVSAMEASVKNGAFKENTKELLETCGGLPTEEKPLLLYQTFDKSGGFIKHMQMASAYQDIPFEDELNLFFKENTSFRTAAEEHDLKGSPRWNDSFHSLSSMTRVVGEPFPMPRFLTANDAFRCIIAAIHEGVCPFVWRVMLLGEYQDFLKHDQFSVHQLKDFIFLSFHSMPQHAVHFRADIEAHEDIKMAANEENDPFNHADRDQLRQEEASERLH